MPQSSHRAHIHVHTTNWWVGPWAFVNASWFLSLKRWCFSKVHHIISTTLSRPSTMCTGLTKGWHGACMRPSFMPGLHCDWTDVATLYEKNGYTFVDMWVVVCVQRPLHINTHAQWCTAKNVQECLAGVDNGIETTPTYSNSFEAVQTPLKCRVAISSLKWPGSFMLVWFVASKPLSSQ